MPFSHPWSNTKEVLAPAKCVGWGGRTERGASEVCNENQETTLAASEQKYETDIEYHNLTFST